MTRTCKVKVWRIRGNHSCVANLPTDATELASALSRHLAYRVGYEVSTHQAGPEMDPNPCYQPEEPERRLCGIARTLQDLPMYAENPFVFIDPQQDDDETPDQEAPSHG